MNQLVIGKYISLKRKQKNMTQEQLAEKLGVSNKTISKWETGKCMPDYSIVKNLCDELEITVAELFDGESSGEKSVRIYDEEQFLDLLRRTQELEDIRQRVENFTQVAQQDMNKKQQELLAPIQDKLRNAIKAVGDEKGYAYIIDNNPGIVLYTGNAAIDATPLVKAKLGLK